MWVISVVQPSCSSLIRQNQVAFLEADGGHDIHKQLDLSGEPLIPQLRQSFKLKDPISLLKYQALTIEGRDYEEAYSDYWITTAEEDGQ
jgi:amidase